MAEQPFKVGRNAKELLRYTLRATRTVSDDISWSDARAVFQKAAALEDVKDIQRVCETAVHKKQHKAMTAAAAQNTRPAGILPWA